MSGDLPPDSGTAGLHPGYITDSKGVISCIALNNCSDNGSIQNASRACHCCASAVLGTPTPPCTRSFRHRAAAIGSQDHASQRTGASGRHYQRIGETLGARLGFGHFL